MLFTSVVGLGLTVSQMYFGAQADAAQWEADKQTQLNNRYAKVYSQTIKNININKQRNNAEQNVAAIYQDKVLSNIEIKQRQEKAQALVEISAATAGVDGGSVNAAIYNTKRNEAFEINNKNQQADQSLEQVLAQVGNNRAAVLEVRDYELDFSNQPTIYNSLARLDGSDFENIGNIYGEFTDMWSD